jgi:DinB superfamily
VAGHDLPGLASRIRAAAAALSELAPAVERGRPWPLSDDFGYTPEAQWGPPETLAHVAEMIPYWTGEIERVLDASADAGPTPFGRTGDDPLRLGVLERDRTLPPRELFARIDAGAERLAKRLEELGETQGGRLGVHRTVGELTIGGIAARFVADHLEEHDRQLRSQLRER